MTREKPKQLLDLLERSSTLPAAHQKGRERGPEDRARVPLFFFFFFWRANLKTWSNMFGLIHYHICCVFGEVSKVHKIMVREDIWGNKPNLLLVLVLTWMKRYLNLKYSINRNMHVCTQILQGRRFYLSLHQRRSLPIVQ